jgi:cation diffusion facilitator CzcD-associated flavoprotein CzcO
MTTKLQDLPVAVIGGGPIGLAAAAHLIERGLPVKLYEAGATVGANLRDWGHVRVFSPWEHNIDGAAQEILERNGWRVPPVDDLPTGDELCDEYLDCLAATPEMAEIVETNARIEAISRRGADKVLSKERETRPFELRVVKADGSTRHDLVRAVIDASGTWTIPNPIGATGMPAHGEREHAGRIAYGMRQPSPEISRLRTTSNLSCLKPASAYPRSSTFRGLQLAAALRPRRTAPVRERKAEVTA